MIREKKEIQELGDDQFYQLIEPSEKIIVSYCQNYLINNFFAFMIWALYKNNAIWSNYTFDKLYKQALEHLANDMPKYNDLDFNNIQNILKNNYSIYIKNKNPIKIEEIEKS